MNMKFLFRKLGFLLLLSFFISCGKDGDPGAQGPEGTQGVPGEDGKDGKDGTKTHSGTTDPTSAIGNVGDFYINLTSKKLFGPKQTNGQWGTGISLTGGANGTNGTDGKDGIDGTDGNTILSGYGAPTNNDGRDGDFYINLTNMDFYGPRNKGDWGKAISLRGKSESASYVYQVKSANWEYDSENGFYFVNIDIKELDEAIFEDGYVNMALSFDDNPKFYEIIPSYFGQYSFSANYSVGRIGLFAEFKGSGNRIAPADALVKIVLTYAEIGN